MSQCQICFADYKPDDQITVLDCDKSHYFHTKCITEWIEKGHFDCPFCRASIKKKS